MSDRHDILEELGDALRERTPRAKRACEFGDLVAAILRDYLPPNREFRHKIIEELRLAAFESNLAIINVPLEKDYLDKLQLERAMIEDHPMFILANKTSPLS